MDALQALVLAKGYTDETIKGEGAIKGKDGQSAYQIAVAHGFEGTEEQWLESLKGASEVTILVSSEAQEGNYSILKAFEDMVEQVLASPNFKDGSIVSVIQPYDDGNRILIGTGSVTKPTSDILAGSVLFSDTSDVDNSRTILGLYDFNYVLSTDKLTYDRNLYSKDITDRTTSIKRLDNLDKSGFILRTYIPSANSYILNAASINDFWSWLVGRLKNEGISAYATSGEDEYAYLDDEGLSIYAEDDETTYSADSITRNRKKINLPSKAGTLALQEAVDTLAEKVTDIELFKFPNAVIHGDPTINNGQISDFANTNYLVMPSTFDWHGKGFEFKMAFTTKDDITTPQNILGGKFCMALFVQNGKLNLRVSSNGTSWDIVNLEGTTTIEANKTYYAKINFTRLNYTLSISTNDETYEEIGSVSTGDISPHPAEIYIGVGNNFNNPFKGIINLNKCYLKVNGAIIWQGMDDAGLSTRLATDLDNIDEQGIEAVKEIISTEGYAKIDDTSTTSTDNVWSAKKINDSLAGKQDFVIYNSIEEFNKKKGTSITVVSGIDNMKDIVNAMSNGEMLIITIAYASASDVYFGLNTSTGWTKMFTFIKANGLCDVECRTTTPSTFKRVFNVDGVIGDWQELVTSDNLAYSTTEAIIGTWVDGRPVYRRVIETNSSDMIESSEGYFEKSIPFSYSNVDRVISLRGVIFSDGNDMPLPYIAAISTGDWGALYTRLYENTIVLHLGNGATSHTNRTVKVIVEYIKS